MSSQDETSTTGASGERGAKKRRMRACDMCRRRKVRCDGGETTGNKCSNCIAFAYECTYLAGTDKRFSDVAYVQSLENEVADLKRQLDKLRAEASATSTPRLGSDTSRSTPQLQSSIGPHTPAPFQQSMSPSSGTEEPDEGDDEDEGLIDHFKHLNVEAEHKHFLGRSSNLMLIQTAMDLKDEYVSADKPEPKRPRTNALDHTFSKRRAEFWEPFPWVAEPKRPHANFPEPALMTELVDLFFTHVNLYFPILHRHTFENDMRRGLHLVDQGFGSVLLCVCALGARFSTDPRVMFPGTNTWHSAGWQWFQQVQEAHKVVNLSPPTLYDLQVASLAAAYVNGSSIPHSSFAAIGHGLRLAQDMGAHRRTTYTSSPTVESELRKRAFWGLVAVDRGMCSVLGRPCSIQEEDFDVDLPAECDDEHWVVKPNGEVEFQQPPGKPSIVAFYNSMLRLGRIHAFALRSIYSVKLSKLRSDPQWAQRVVSELDSELNKWIDSLPDHLRWDPHKEDILFMNQSALLHSSYYTLQITVHRPFIPSPRNTSVLSFPSLAICTNAARSCVHLLDAQYRRTGTPFHSWYQLPLFNCAVVLLMNVWGGRRAGSTTDPVKEMDDVYKAMRMLQILEPRWSTAGRFWDILYDLASVGDLPLPQPIPSTKRRRSEDDFHGSQDSSPTMSSASDSIQSRPIAGSRRVQHYQQLSSSQLSPFASTPQPAVPLVLPTHSDELGRLPMQTPTDTPTGGEQGNWDSLNAANYAVDPFSFNPAVFDAAFRPATHHTTSGMDAFFGGLIPATSYDDALAAFVARNAQHVDATGAVHPLDACLSPMVPPEQHQCGPPQPEPAPGGSWNGVPGTAEWDELEQYITSLSMPQGGGYAPG